MNWKQYKLLSISTGLFVLLMLAGGGLLFKTRASYLNQKQTLKAKLGELDKLNKRTPFPNPDNQEVLEGSLKRVETFYQKLINEMADGQVEPKDIEPARFPALLNGTLYRLRQYAKKEGIGLPQSFGFGFESYADGSLPNSEDVARLTSQLQIIESLVATVFSSGAEGVLGVERDRFDKQTPKVEGLSRRRPTASESVETTADSDSELYAAEKITLQFTGNDQTLWAVLNALSAHDQFVIVTSVNLENPVKPNVSAIPVYRSTDGGGKRRPNEPPMGDAFMEDDPLALFSDAGSGLGTFPPPIAQTEKNDKAELGPPLSHEERIVAGRESVRMKITVKVCQFKKQDEDPVEENPGTGGGSS